METGLTARAAVLAIVDAVSVQPALRVPLDDALGSVLAEAVVSPIDIPAHTNSAMDGYAVRGADIRGASRSAPRQLRVVEHLPAGQFSTRSIGPGESARVFTGTVVPDGVDTVVRQEDTDQGALVVSIYDDRDLGGNLRFPGEDIRAGATILDPGALIGPAEIGVLASMAVAHPVVFRRPRVGILAGGDEIVDIDQPDQILAGTKIASSNTHTLAALVRQTGGEPVNLGIARDTPDSVREHLERALDCDLLITTAGISVGDHDHLRAVVTAMGGRLAFWRLRIRPGAPAGFGTLGTVPWIGLPGNPVSTMVTFELLARPAIRKMMGHRARFRRAVPVRTGEPITVGRGLQHFLRVRLHDEPAGTTARLTGAQGSGILTSMLAADGLLIVPEGPSRIEAGAELSAIRFDEPIHRETPAY